MPSNITQEQVDRWIADLRSGKYEKTKYALRDSHNCYCALGVLATQFDEYDIDDSGEELIVKDTEEGVGYKPFNDLLGGEEETNDVFGISDTNPTFDEVADYIERTYKTT